MKRITGKAYRIIKEKAGTKEGLLFILVVMWVLNTFLLYWLANNFLDHGSLFHGVFAFLSFSIFGLLNVSIIKLARHLINLRIQNTEVKSKQNQSDMEFIQSQERFITAMDKAVEKIRSSGDSIPTQNELQTENFLFLKVDGKIYKVLFESLLYAEANGNYTKIVLENNTIQPTMTLSSLEALLPKKTFIRLHRSFLINKSKVNHIEGNRVFIGKTEIPIGSNYREGFLRELGV